MILAVLVVSVAFGTETKFQVRIILLRTSADSTFMLGDTLTAITERNRLASRIYRFFKLISSVDLFRILPVHISGSKEKDNKVQQ